MYAKKYYDDLKKKVLLDLNKINLWGYETKKNVDYINDLIEQINNGEKLLPVMVYQIDEINYQLTRILLEPFKNRIDGGHNRAIAHYLAKVPLECRLIGYRPEITEKVNIKNIQLLPNELWAFSNITGM